MDDKIDDSTNKQTTELLASLIKQLSEKEDTDRKRDITEAAATKKTRNLYLGVVASILTLISTSVVQYASPPRIAGKSDIVDVIESKRDSFRPDAWTKTNDIETMSVLRAENHQHRVRIHERLDEVEKQHSTDRQQVFIRLKVCEIEVKNLKEQLGDR